jgi:hypothetical protein
MAFLFEGPAVLFLRPNDLFIFTKSGQRQVLFPTTVIKNQEVVDKKLLEKLLKDFFSRLPKQRVPLFLSHAIVFDRSVKVEAQTIVEEELNRFLEAIPLPVTHIVTKVIQTPQRDFFFATNGDIYETILAIARQYGWQIKFVVPLSLFDDILKGQQVSYAFFLRVLKEKKLLAEGNFLQKKEESKEVKKIPIRQYLVLGVCLLFLSGALLFAAYTFHLSPFPAKTQPKHVTVVLPTKPIVVDTPTPISTEEAKLKKEDIKIQVLNGSDIAGQASKLKDQLEALGFGNIETGNAEGPMSNATIVIFSENVPQDLQDEILIELKKTFVSVDTQELPKAEGFNISITTGNVM